MTRWYVGIDSGDQSHVVVVQDREGREVARREIEHSGHGLEELTDWLRGISGGRPEEVSVALEVPRGAVVAALISQSFKVHAINPKQVDRFRDRYSPAGAKDDRFDASVLAGSLRTDPQAFRRLCFEAEHLVRLRGLLGILEDLKQELRRLANRLRAELHDYFPQVLKLVPAADEPWLWDLLEKAPLPEQAARLSRRSIERLLHNRHVRRLDPDDVLAQLDTQPLPRAAGVAEAATHHLSLLIPRLRLVDEQLRHCQRDLERLVDQLATPTDEGDDCEHRDAQILRSLPGAGSLVTATMLAEATEPLTRRDYHALRVQAGVAPVTRQSGRIRCVLMRQACNPRLRLALFYWAAEATKLDPRLRALYQRLRARGHGHARALRTIGDRLLHLLVVLLTRNAIYDPALRLAQ